MIRDLLFSKENNRGVATDREPGQGEYVQIAEEPPWFVNTPGRYEWTGGAVSEWAGWAAEQAAKAEDDARTAAELAIRQKYDRQLDDLGKPYLENEQKSWSVQEAEARAYIANPAAVVPYITTMATTRGISVSSMAEKIRENYDLFRSESARILGEQQKELDALS